MPRRMDILFGIRMKMVVSVFGSPPQNAFLRATLRDECKCELKQPAG